MLLEDNYTKFEVKSVNLSVPSRPKSKIRQSFRISKRKPSSRVVKPPRSSLAKPQTTNIITTRFVSDNRQSEKHIDMLREEKAELFKFKQKQNKKSKGEKNAFKRSKESSLGGNLIKGFNTCSGNLDFNPLHVSVNTRFKGKEIVTRTIDSKLEKVPVTKLKTDISQTFLSENQVNLKNFFLFNNKKRITNLKTSTINSTSDFVSLTQYKSQKEKLSKLNEKKFFENKENENFVNKRQTVIGKGKMLPKIKSAFLKVSSINKTDNIKLGKNGDRIEKLLETPFNLKYATLKKTMEKKEAMFLSKNDKHNMHYLKNSYF